MLVSWNWLSEYVKLDMSVDELTHRLTMSGLNLEEVHRDAHGEVVIDLEVTSNRPDCLGHIGVAREIGVLFNQPLSVPDPQPPASAVKTASVTEVTIQDESLCPLYVARVLRGVRVGPSPEWLQRRLIAVGMTPVNNIVDVTNYVLLECSQPLHAFDFDKLHGGKIIVRPARSGEKLTAINHEQYTLDPEMLVIADADRPVAIAGVMGGADTEIGEQTTNVLIEAADFAPLSVRSTSRKLKLPSDSSYRFERGVDREQVDWASRRCCELILKVAGGELLEGGVVAGQIPSGERPPIGLRFSQLARVLGIEIPAETATRILQALGLRTLEESTDRVEFIPPSWRRDLTREADLVEEVARIHGYDRIPDNVPVPLAASAPTLRERVTDRVRDFLNAAHFYEAITLSLVSEPSRELFTPRGELPPITVEHSDFKKLGLLRQSLVPSLLECRRENERQGTFNAELFEIAKVYLKAQPGTAEEEVEPTMLSLVSGRPLQAMMGVVTSLVARLNRQATVDVRPARVPQFVEGRGAELLLNGQPWGWVGELDRRVTDILDLQDAVTVAEMSLAPLERLTDLTPQAEELPKYPGVERDLNFVLDEGVLWRDLADVVRSAAGPLLERIDFGGQYRGKQLDAGKKSYVVRLFFRSPERTLTSEEVEAAQHQAVRAAGEKLAATLR